MGGKSSPSNDQQVQFEMQQAEQAKQTEAARQARLASGTQAVNDIFAGGNFNDAFYNKFNKAQLDYQEPQLQTQFDQSKKALTYQLANAGMLRSKAAADAAGLLEQQDLTGDAAIRASADQQTSGLRSNILNEKQGAINQLYSTEDPTIAANTATSMVQQGQIQTPNLNPLGAMFTPFLIGGANAFAQGYQNYNYNQAMQPRSPTGGGAIVTNTV
jgi:hypothetical protein